MRLSVPQLINLGLSGYAFVGDDIGGFNGSPTPELLTAGWNSGCLIQSIEITLPRARGTANHGGRARA